MKTTRILSTLALFTALALVGCNTPATEPGTDGGRDAARLNDAATTPDTGNDGGGIATPDSGIDGGSDAGCTSSMAHCNSCTTPATDPLNACSGAVTNCIPFDNTRVPGWPDHIPAITP